MQPMMPLPPWLSVVCGRMPRDQEMRSTINDVEGQITDLENTVSDLQVSSKAGKSNQTQDMADQVGKATREYVFWTVKFYEGPDDLIMVTKRVIKYIRTALGLPEDEFVKTYSDVVSTALSDQRNYVQSEAKKRAFGKFIVRDTRICWYIREHNVQDSRVCAHIQCTYTRFKLHTCTIFCTRA
jgi:hypothetical protein